MEKRQDTAFFGQPRGLFVLCFTESWWAFSFYGMRAMLVYYMTKQLMISQEHSSLIYGAYAAGCYFTGLFGGIAADKLLGVRNAVLLGGSLMALGHFMMAFESLFYFALVMIAIGSGFFLPSLSSQIKALYEADDPRLASAYNVYYLGINIGAFLSPVIGGTVGEVYGWPWGFAVAGVGMLIALGIYLSGMKHLPAEQTVRKPSGSAKRRSISSDDRRRFAILLGIMAVVVVFRGAYEQIGNTIALWADSGIDREVMPGLTVPMTWFQSLNPFTVFLLTPVMVIGWQWLARNGREPSSLKKMAMGAAICAISYVMIALVAGQTTPEHPLANGLWLVAFVIVMTIGELLILPVGLGFFGRYAPKGFEATAIALWFFANFFGNILAGSLGALWSTLSRPQFFGMIAAVAFGAALLLLLFIPAGDGIEAEEIAR